MVEPKRYVVQDHPVVLDRVSDGTERARILDLRTGAFVYDDHYRHLVAAGGRGVEEVGRAPFDRLVAALRQVASDDRQMVRLVWDRADGEADYCTEHEGVVHSIRCTTDEGAARERRYVILVNGQEVDRLDAWPPLWSKGVVLRAELRGLLDLAGRAEPVTREDVCEHLVPRGGAVTTAGPNLEWPPWADRTAGADDLYVELGGMVAGARIPPPHYGQYVDLFVVDCSIVDVEAVVGAVEPVVKVHYDDPDTSIAYLTVNQQTIRVMVETRPGRETMVVTVHFPS